jgi:hypothetical protein
MSGVFVHVCMCIASFLPIIEIRRNNSSCHRALSNIGSDAGLRLVSSLSSHRRITFVSNLIQCQIS